MKDGKPEITFTETRVVQDQYAGTKDETRFEEGKTYALDPRSADRWVRRGVATWASDEDRQAGLGASGDVSNNLSDHDRVSPDGRDGDAAARTGKDPNESTFVPAGKQDHPRGKGRRATA